MLSIPLFIGPSKHSVQSILCNVISSIFAMCPIPFIQVSHSSLKKLVETLTFQSAVEEADGESGEQSDRRKRGAAAAKAAAVDSGRKRPRRGQMEIEYEEEREDVRQPHEQQ